MLMVLIITLLALLITKLQVTASPVEIAHGRVHMAILDTQNFVCQTEPFQTPFTSDDIAVHLSPARPGGSLPEYQSSTVWVDHVTRYNFTICLRPSAKINFARRVDVHWLAYLYKPSSGMSGVAYIPMWTAGTKCVLITYSERVTAIPTVFVTVAHEGRVGRGNDASTVWTEDVTVEDFKLCLRELKNFDGAHREIKVNWLVLSALPAEWVKARLTGILTFPNTLTPPEKFIYSYCQEFPFPKQYFTVPTMIASPSHRNNIYSSRNVWPKHNAITYWIESIDTLNYTVCVKDLQPYRVHHDPILVNFLVFGDLHPCLTVNCGNHASCQAYSSSDVRCECPKSCPVYQEEYCANDGKTYSNMCEYDQMVCNTGNEIKLHPGSCEAFVLKHGRVAVMLDREYFCVTVQYGHAFKRNATLHVFVSLDYHNTTQSLPHDSAVVWVDKIHNTSFDACVLKAGRNDIVPPDGGLAFVDFVAYEGSPADTVSGTADLAPWWDGTQCQTVAFPQNKFPHTPYVIVTAQHTTPGMRSNALTLWLEDLTTSGLRVCARELQTFDREHKGIHVHWLAFATLPEDMVAEHHKMPFTSDQPPSLANAFCDGLNFTRTYETMPTIVLSVNHYTGAGGLVPEYNSITAWVEIATKSYCQVCLRQSRGLNGHDPLFVDVVVLG